MTLRLILNGLERSMIHDKSTKVGHAQEDVMGDLYKDLAYGTFKVETGDLLKLQI